MFKNDVVRKYAYRHAALISSIDGILLRCDHTLTIKARVGMAGKHELQTSTRLDSCNSEF